MERFEGKLASREWATPTKCSQDTANRVINDLVKRGILAKDAAGRRSASYSLIEPAEKRHLGHDCEDNCLRQSASLADNNTSECPLVRCRNDRTSVRAERFHGRVACVGRIVGWRRFDAA